MPAIFSNNRWVRGAVLGAAILAVLFVATGGSLWHVDAPGSQATCPICHLAHMTASPAVLAEVLVAPLVVGWFHAAEPDVAFSDVFSAAPPVRGPPA